jgi:hypothetical protein
MNTPANFLCLVLALAAAARADEPQCVVRFSNDDVLTGSPLSISSDMLEWKSPVLEQPAAFFLGKVLEVSLPGTPPRNPAGHEATLSLTNGDTVRGQLAGVSDGIVSLDTWFAGRMNFNRLMVAGVTIDKRPEFLFRGPTGLDGWKQSGDPPAWSFGRSAFRASAAGGIARDGLLPDECAVSFDAAWKGDSIRLKVILFSDDPATDNPSTGYEISFQRGSIHLRNNTTQAYLGSAHSQALMESDKIRVELRASVKTGRVAIFINGRIVEVWSDPDFGKSGFGRGLHFVSSSTLPLRISDIGVAAWDGMLEQTPDPQPGMARQVIPHPQQAAKPAEGRMELANGDTLPGEVISIQDGLIALKTPLGEFRLPVSRLRNVALKPAEAERCKRRNGDVRAWFPDGSSLVFRLDGCGNGTMTGSSQNFGSATFKLAAFSRIEFNIYSPEFADKRATGDW